MHNDYDLYTGALRVFHDFGASNNSIEDYSFSYDFNSPQYEYLKSKYHIDSVAGNGSELEKALKLLKWCSQNVLHNGGTKDVEFIPKTSGDILDYAFGKGREFGVYCRLQAIVFTECCLALGIKSRILHCLPFSPNDFDTHVVSIVYIPDLSKFMKSLDMLDENVSKAVVTGLKKGAEIIVNAQKRRISAKSQRLADAISKSRIYTTKKGSVGISTGYHAKAFKKDKDGFRAGIVGMVFEFGRPGKKGDTMKQVRNGETVTVNVKNPYKLKIVDIA